VERWFTPVLFVAAAGFVSWYNGGHQDSQLLFPGTHLVPGYEGDIFAQGRLTWQLFLGVGGVTGALALVNQIRAWRRKAEPES
jgi:hypothetical protein